MPVRAELRAERGQQGLSTLLLILVGGTAHELAHSLNTLIFLLDLDLRRR